MAHILHVAKFYPPTTGGMERVVQDYAGMFVEMGHTVTVLAFADDAAVGNERPREGLEVLRFKPDLAIASGQISRAYVSAVQRLVPQADIVHMHEPNPLGTFALLRQHARTPVHITWHGDILRQWYAMPVMKPMQAALCRRAATIQVSSEGLRRSSYMLPSFPDKTRVVPLGIDVMRFASAVPDVAGAAAWRSRIGGPFILATGRLAAYKGYDVLLRAIAGTRVRVAIVGKGSLLQPLMALRSKLGLDRQVTFLGAVSERELIELYSACNFFVLPSNTNGEAFGLVQVEAMASGKAVINTRLETGVPEVSINGLTGLTVPPNDPDALRAAILKLWADPELTKALGHAARARALANYDRREVARRVATLYGLPVPEARGSI